MSTFAPIPWEQLLSFSYITEVDPDEDELTKFLKNLKPYEYSKDPAVYIPRNPMIGGR